MQNKNSLSIKKLICKINMHFSGYSYGGVLLSFGQEH